MRRFLSAFVALTSLLSMIATVPTFAQTAQTTHPLVGIRHIKVMSPERPKPLDVTIWYPAGPGGTLVKAGENKIFIGTPAMEDAPVEGDHHPLLLLSHGSGATVATMAWLANSLAAQGYVVAGPDHQGTTSGDSTPADTPSIWQRTNDISRVLTALTEDPQWKRKIDADRIGVLGFSLGGTTALSLAGARFDLDAYIRYCATYPQMADCVWFAGGKAFRDQVEIKVPPFDLKSVDRARYEQSNRDRRLKLAILVDPGMVLAIRPESLSTINIPLYFINQGSADTVPVAVKADKVASLALNAQLKNIVGAVHMSFLNICKPTGAEFLKTIGETDKLCDDAGTRSRADLHGELASAILEDLTQAFGNP
jgi:predicted dienelactone hydrolase